MVGRVQKAGKWPARNPQKTPLTKIRVQIPYYLLSLPCAVSPGSMPVRRSPCGLCSRLAFNLPNAPGGFFFALFALVRSESTFVAGVCCPRRRLHPAGARLRARLGVVADIGRVDVRRRLAAHGQHVARHAGGGPQRAGRVEGQIEAARPVGRQAHDDHLVRRRREPLASRRRGYRGRGGSRGRPPHASPGAGAGRPAANRIPYSGPAFSLPPQMPPRSRRPPAPRESRPAPRTRRG